MHGRLAAERDLGVAAGLDTFAPGPSAGPAGRSGGRHRAGIAVQPLQLIRVQPPQHPRREQLLEQPTNPPAPCQRVSNCTRQPSPSDVTTQVVTIEERSSDSVSTRPGSGSSTRIRNLRARPPTVIRKPCTVPAPTPPSSTRNCENTGGKKREW
jgi:hypothetical protein